MNSLIKILTAFILAGILSLKAQEVQQDSLLTSQPIGVAFESLDAALSEANVFSYMKPSIKQRRKLPHKDHRKK